MYNVLFIIRVFVFCNDFFVRKMYIPETSTLHKLHSAYHKLFMWCWANESTYHNKQTFYSFPVFIFPLRMREINVLSLILFKCWLERKRARWIKYVFVYAGCLLFTRFLVHVIIFTNNRFLFSFNFLIIFEPKCS